MLAIYSSIRTLYEFLFGNKGIVLQIYFQISLLHSARAVCEYMWEVRHILLGTWLCVCALCTLLCLVLYVWCALVCVTIVTNSVIRSVRHTIVCSAYRKLFLFVVDGVSVVAFVVAVVVDISLCWWAVRFSSIWELLLLLLLVPMYVVHCL